MDHVIEVQIIKSIEYLSDNASNSRLFQLTLIFKNSLHVLVKSNTFDQLHNQVYIMFRFDDTFKTDNIRMFQRIHDFSFTDDIVDHLSGQHFLRIEFNCDFSIFFILLFFASGYLFWPFLAFSTFIDLAEWTGAYKTNDSEMPDFMEIFIPRF